MYQYHEAPTIGFLRRRPSVKGDVWALPSPRGSEPIALPKLKRIALPKPKRSHRTTVKLRPSDIREPGWPGFLRWLQRDFPATHDVLLKRRPDLVRAVLQTPALGQLAPAGPPTRGQQIADFVLPLLQVYQQRQILKLQLARAKAGQPPLDVESLSPPATRIELEAGAKTQRMGLIVAGALGLGAVAYFLTRGRARA